MKQSDPTVGEIDRSPRGALHRKICAEKTTGTGNPKEKPQKKPPDLPAVLMGIRFNDQLTGS